MATVIDALIVTLGLDAANYKKGRETAEKETSETARKSQIAADQITKSLTEVGKTIASLFLGFESATGFAKWLGDLNKGEADLGRTASTLGITAHELNKYGLAAREAGQDSSAVYASFKALTDAAVKFQSGQGTSPILDLMRQAGVSVFDTTGKLRNQGEVYEELARKTAAWGQQMQSARFAAAGIADGEIKYLIQSNKQREDQLRLAERNNAIDQDSVAKAQALQEYWRNVGDQIEAVGQKILSTITPALQSALTMVSDLMGSFKDTGGLDRIAQTFRIIANLAKQISDSVKFWSGGSSPISKFNDYNNFIFKQYGKILDFFDPGSPKPPAASSPNTPQVPPDRGYIPPAGTKASRYNNPGNILDKAGNERRYATPEEGAAALESDLRIKMQRGLKTVDAIITAYEGSGKYKNDVPAYIADVQHKLGKNELTEADIRQLALAISTHESGPSARVAPPAARQHDHGASRYNQRAF